MEQLETRLRAGLKTLQLSLSDYQVVALLGYLELLAKWNKTYNFTAVRSPELMVDRHLLDSLSVAVHLKGERFVDIGSGAGLPGIPLAIVFPKLHFDLIDSLGKRTRFLFQVKMALGLDNIEIHQCRAETFQLQLGYDGVLSRAFASLADMLLACGHLTRNGGVFYAMKGVYPAAELADIGPAYFPLAVHRLEVPGVDEERHLVLLSAKSEKKIMTE